MPERDGWGCPCSLIVERRQVLGLYQARKDTHGFV
jgi:hypothetical protein